MSQFYETIYMRLLVSSCFFVIIIWTVNDLTHGRNLFAVKYVPRPCVKCSGHAKTDPVISLERRSGFDPENVQQNLVNTTGKTSGRLEIQSNGFSTSRNIPRKLLLYWTRCFRHECPWGRQGTELFEPCEYSHCDIDVNKARVGDASIVLFHHRDEVLDFPEVRYPWQLYVHYTFEPPARMEFTFLDVYEQRLNLTVSYRRDGNIFVPYSKVVEKDTGTHVPFVPRVPYQNKTRGVAWLVSHCHALSHRDEYVIELRKYINVDIYGKCGNMSCPVEGDCFQYLEGKYKFYLSFENTICRDYASEKIFNPLNYELVPIVMGGANYSEIIPARSFIDIKDFQSPRKLAEYLHRLSNNSTEYFSYFAWKTDFEIRKQHMPAMFCELCKFLHVGKYAGGESIRPPYTITYREWFQNTCQNELIEDMRKNW